ncbi:glycosyltransferase family 2 protein [Prevotella aurantiaca]|jgi:glycosyltransferase, group 2 family protein|uniref:Glycosyltransferase family 2 protein n=1 Tax=Prevotella aurantiaca TaxID=596085 RepID=A0A930MXV9_9BACT|nr:glycosyltransferase family 2 protein [Prevotella aurantiaca]MBF1383530.1 glycosyltransferase family 2 protein [Prevotella aurantiaca]
MVKISILVAVYNAEQYLRQCLNSLVSQTFQDIEIICVDDASTDSSLSILKEYAVKDNRVKVVHLHENAGIAKARNTGLRISTGDFIAFVDSDDWLSEDACEKVHDVFTNYSSTDTVLFQVKSVYGEKEVVFSMPTFETLDGFTAFKESLTWNIHGIYAVKKELHLCFPYDESAIAYSDENVTRLHYLKSQEIRTCEGIYYYRQHLGSVTHKVSLRRFDYLLANKSMKQQLEALNVSSNILDIYEDVRWRNVVGLYMFYFLHRKELDKLSRKQGLEIIKSSWQSIEQDRLPCFLKRKFGYIPFQKSWIIFRLQEESYFFLRALLGRNKEEL